MIIFCHLRGIENEPNLVDQLFHQEGLLHEVLSIIQDTVMRNHVGCISGHKEPFYIGI